MGGTYLWILFALLIMLIIYRLVKFVRYFLIMRKYPGPPSYPIIGNLFDIWGPPEVVLSNIRKFGETYDYFIVWTFQYFLLNISDPDDIQILLSSTKHSKKSVIYSLLNWLKDGLLTSHGKKWFQRRKILTPAFHFNILQQFVNTFVSQSQKLVDELKHECDKPFVAIDPYITEYTLQSILESAMGTTLNRDDKGHLEYRRLIQRMGDIAFYRLVRPWLTSPIRWFTKIHWEQIIIGRKLNNFTRNVIKQREANFKPSDIPKDDEDYSIRKRKNLAMLDLLLLAKSNGQIDDNGILEEVETFTFEGHDTTLTNIIFTLMLLANNKEAQDNAVREIYQVLGERTRPTYEHLQELKYLENCIKESLRLYPSVYFMSRETSETIQFREHILPKDNIVNVHVLVLHRNPKLYPDPEKFDPDRFSPENVEKRHPYAYIPFSAGPRNCIGQKFAMLEIKTVLLHILREFELLPVDTPDTITLKADIILKTMNPIKIKIQPRIKTSSV